MDLFTTKVEIKPEWMDHNGHLNVAYFVLAFDYATDAVYEEWEIGEHYPDDSGCSVYTLGMDVDYLAELFAGDEVIVSTQLLDWDHKRIHYYHRMLNAKTNEVVAVNECLVMNVHLESRRSAPFPETVQKKLNQVMDEQEGLEKPEKSGRRLSIRKK